MRDTVCRISFVAISMAAALPILSFAQGHENGDKKPDLISCEKSKDENIAWYVGPYKGEDNVLTGEDLARDAYCADRFKRENYPNGFVTIFGSSRIGEEFNFPNPPGSTFSLTFGAVGQDQREYNQTYAGIRTFAYEWTRDYGSNFPILTGAGPGLMEAGSRGAMEARKEYRNGRESVGYTTYYDRVDDWKSCSSRCYKGFPQFSRYPFNPSCSTCGDAITSDGLIFSSVSIREAAMIMHSAAIVIAPGGAGTEWEIYQTLEMLKSRQLSKVPVYFVGQRIHWNSFVNRVRDLEDRGTISAGELVIEFAQCPADLVNRLAHRLGLTQVSAPEPDIACAKPSKYETRSLRELGI